MAKELKIRIDVDEEQIILDLPKFELVPPETGIYEEPVAYYKANLKWAKIIEGFVAWLATTAVWKDAENENDIGVQSILTFLERVELMIQNCDDVEDCIESSTIINNMITNITNNTTNITNNTTNITNLTAELEAAKDNSAIDGVDLPPITEVTEDEDAMCKAANFMADQIVEVMNEAWEAARAYSLQEYIRLILGDIWYNWGAVREFGQWAITVGNPTLNDDAAAHRDKLAKYLYCNNLNKEALMSEINLDPEITEPESALLIRVLENTRQSQLNEWAHIGAAGDTSFSCYCSNTKVWDFSVGGTLNWQPQGGNRATWAGNGWTAAVFPYGRVIVIEKGWIWPADFVITETRWYVVSPTAPDYNLVYGMPYVTGVFPATSGDGSTTTPFLSGADINKGTRTGLGIERSVFSGNDRLWKIEVDFTGTPPTIW